MVGRVYGTNLAAQPLFSSIVTVATLPWPAQAPCHCPKDDPESGVAVNSTTVPSGKLCPCCEQLSQSIPEGLLTIAPPDPVGPRTPTVSVKVVEGTLVVVVVGTLVVVVVVGTLVVVVVVGTLVVVVVPDGENVAVQATSLFIVTTPSSQSASPDQPTKAADPAGLNVTTVPAAKVAAQVLFGGQLAPAGLLVTPPLLPLVVTVSVNVVVGTLVVVVPDGENVAVQATSLFIVTTPSSQSASPDQPTKAADPAGLNVTTVPAAKMAVQVRFGGQSAPAGLLVTPPLSPLVVTVSVNVVPGGVRGANVAVQARSLFIVTTPSSQSASPDQPAKAADPAGLNVTTVPAAKVAAQVLFGGQLTPAGLLVTPPLLPLVVTVSLNVVPNGKNVAAQPLSPSIVTVATLPWPAQAPCQKEKDDPRSGVAVNCTTVPAGKTSSCCEQLLQSIPAGLLTIAPPDPVGPRTPTVSVKVAVVVGTVVVVAGTVVVVAGTVVVVASGTVVVDVDSGTVVVVVETDVVEVVGGAGDGATVTAAKLTGSSGHVRTRSPGAHCTPISVIGPLNDRSATHPSDAVPVSVPSNKPCTSRSSASVPVSMPRTLPVMPSLSE